MQLFYFQGLNELRESDFVSIMGELDGLKVPTFTDIEYSSGDL